MALKRLLAVLLMIGLITGCSSGGGDGTIDPVPTIEEQGLARPGLLLALLLALGLMTDWTPDWEDVEIDSVRAPDEYTVKVAFKDKPPADAAAALDTYEIDSEKGSLTIDVVEYDAALNVATLTTKRQKLGITYTVTVLEEAEPLDWLQADFLSADTASLWTTDFGDPYFSKYKITADRASVGTHCVVYIEQGLDPSAIEEAASHFDEKVYPTETELYIEAPDIDDNDRILLLGVDGQYYFGGYFDGTNAYPNAWSMLQWGIPSNEMDMVYINAYFGDFDSYHTVIPHEFGHLLYHERHGFTYPYWAYHDEGLAECATRAVNGGYPYGVDFYMADYQGLIGDGLSLVNWTWALYENYVVACLFWSYLAARLDGVESYGEIFDLDTGSPDEVDALIGDRLGSDFATVQMEGMIATWLQADSGIYSYGDMIEFPPGLPPTVRDGVTSVDLEPFAGTYFLLPEPVVNYPGTEGPNIVYAGISGAGNVDLEEPFGKGGGALLVFNSNLEFSAFPAEHSGPDLPAVGSREYGYEGGGEVPRAWLDPPPINPYDQGPLRRWREATRLRLAAEGL